jgi:glycosyltransferase involved in cell wall biosynthesis
MRIGIVLHATPGYSETFFRNKIIFLKNEGFDIKLYVDSMHKGFHLCGQIKGFSFEDKRWDKFINVVNLGLRIIFSPIRAVTLWKANKKDGFHFRQNALSLINSAHILSANVDWLHFGFATTAVDRENVARIIGAKMAVSIRGFDINTHPLKHKGLYNLLWQRLDKLHYIGDGLLKKAVDLGFNIETPSLKITPAIDISMFRNTKAMSKFDNDNILITTIARLHWIKGLNYILEALSIVKEAGINFKYQLIGDGTERESLIFTVDQMQLNHEVHFQGRLSPIEVTEYLKNTDIYIQYSLEEGFCNATIEAQAMGCICIVSDAGGLKENILDGKTGFVVPKRHPDLLAQKIMEVLKLSIEKRMEISNNATNRVKKEFDLNIQKNKFLDFYR